MKRGARRVLLAVVVGGAVVAAVLLRRTADEPEPPPGPYVFTVDGAPFAPTAIVSLSGTPERLREGDLVGIAGLMICLGPPGCYDFTSTPWDDGRLLRRVNGADVVVGIHEAGRWEGATHVTNGALARLDPASAAGLRGVRIGQWSDAAAAVLANVDRARCAIHVEQGVGAGRGLPPLPSGVRYLCLDGQMSPAFEDLAGLEQQHDLRYLRVSARSFDVSLLADTAALRVLDVAGSPLVRPDRLGVLRQLRAIDLSSSGHWLRGSRMVSLRMSPGTPIDADPPDLSVVATSTRLRRIVLAHTKVADIRWLAGMTELETLDLSDTAVSDVSVLAGLPALRRLDVSRTAVADLSPVGTCPALVEIAATRSRVRALPREGLPALARLEMFGAPVGDDDVAQFAALHPSATILHRWRTALVLATAGATSVRVRTGGTCHRNMEDEAVLFELTGAAEVRALLDRIAIDEPSSGEHCLCCGDPSIEITDGASRIAATLGMHHGRRLRWPGGWPGDGELTGPAATAVCRWLADHGHPESLHQLEDPARIAEGKRRLLARYRALVPPDVAVALTTVDSYDEARIAMDRLPEAPARAELLVRLLGAHAWPWSDGPGYLDQLVDETLAGLPVAEVHAALTQVVREPEGCAGVARWLYDYHERWKELPRAQLDALVAATAPWALGHCQRHQSHRRPAPRWEACAVGAQARPRRGCAAPRARPRPTPRRSVRRPGALVPTRARTALDAPRPALPRGSRDRPRRGRRWPLGAGTSSARGPCSRRR